MVSANKATEWLTTTTMSWSAAVRASPPKDSLSARIPSELAVSAESIESLAWWL